MIYRPASIADVPEMADVFLESLVDMYSRNGLAAEPPTRAAMIRDYEFIHGTGSLHVAESHGKIVVIAGGIIRDAVWFLSAFWALPGFREKGVGTTLLKRVRAEAAERGAHTFFTWSSRDLPALAAYLRIGMRPADLILRFQGAPLRLPPVPDSCEARPLDIDVATHFDREARGTSREVDHRFLTETMGAAGRQVIRGGSVVGYYYVTEGLVGPAAWDPDRTSAASVLGLAFHEAAQAGDSIRISLPGSNTEGIDAVLGMGLSLVLTAHLMTSAPFGDMTRYVPWGPTLF